MSCKPQSIQLTLMTDFIMDQCSVFGAFKLRFLWLHLAYPSLSLVLSSVLLNYIKRKLLIFFLKVKYSVFSIFSQYVPYYTPLADFRLYSYISILNKTKILCYYFFSYVVCVLNLFVMLHIHSSIAVRPDLCTF